MHMSMEKKAMTKKGHQIFGEEVHPVEKILATPMEYGKEVQQCPTKLDHCTYGGWLRNETHPSRR